MSTTKARQHPIERAEAALAERPLAAVDLALSAVGATRAHRSEEESAAYLDLLARGVLAVVRGAVAGEEDPVAAMLSDRRCDRLACATLLRLLVFDDAIFSEDRRLLGAPTLFDRVAARTLYPEAGLSTKDQSFQKRDRLRTLIADHEQALIGHVRALRGAEGMAAFRPAFGKLFNSKVNRAVVLPFLPEGVTRQTFDELLASCAVVLECGHAGMLADAEEVDERCRELAAEGEALGTFYAEELMVGLTETLARLVRTHVSESGFSDPAELTLSLRAKRFPLTEPRRPVTVRLDLANRGRGQAREVSIEIEGGGGIDYETTARTIGLLGPGGRMVEFPGTVAARAASDGSAGDELMTRLHWRDPDGTEHLEEDILTLPSQEGDRDWERLMLTEPYSLSPVTEREEFAGQGNAVRDLTKTVLQMGCARIQGEKRVGKTSLANAVRKPITELAERPLAFIVLESGDFNANTTEATIERLGTLIAERVQRADPRLAGLPVPDLADGLSTLTGLFEAAEELAPELGFVIVLDEFDSLPHPDLYRHEPLGDTLFQTLRSLGGKPNVCFVLIGGERMKWVIATHGQALNKFRLVPLDYFGADQRSDYAELVRLPVMDALDFSEEAIDFLHVETAGNPWISKLLLGQLFERQVARRDADVQVDDVVEAIEEALAKIGVESFQHFWDDAIRAEGAAEQEHVSIMRRRVLLALGRCLESRGDTGEEAVVRAARDFNVEESSAREIIRDLTERSILHLDEERMLRCRVPVFERWLPRYGPREIVLGSGDDDTLIARQREIEALRPTHSELAEIASRLKSYRGEDIRTEQLAEWLGQFGGPAEQRAVLPILDGLRFYTRASIEERLADLHGYAQRELARRGYTFVLAGRQRTRRDLLVCALEGGGSGSSQLVKPYREENRVHRDCALDPGEVPAALAARGEEIRAVIVLEDFIGTGGTASGRLRELHAEWTAEGPWPEEVDVFLLVICGFEQGIARVEQAAAEFAWPLEVHVAEPLGDEERCFKPGSVFFDSETDRERARTLCTEVGARLSAKHPLGYGKTEAAICFEYRCPNNSLPVLWKGDERWSPLFARL